MNNRQKREIEKFFDFIKKVIVESNYQNLSYDFIYHHLSRYGTPPKDRNIRFDAALFPAWEDRFKNNPNLNVFVDPGWKYFCQFISADRNNYMNLITANNHIKMYIPLDPEHMYEGANQIFDFLSRNNIPNISKVGTHVRNDSIVIRLINPDDAEKLMKFVRDNKYLQVGLLKTNPFIPNENGVGFACDGMVSYNETIATLICNYIKDSLSKGSFKHIGADDFNMYASNVYKSIFGRKASAEEIYRNSPYFKENAPFGYISNPQEVYSLKIALGLYMESLKKDFNKKSYYDYYYKSTNKDSFMLENNFDQTSYDQETVGILRKSMESLTDYYKSSEKAEYLLSTYIKTGNIQLIPDHNNLRSLFIKRHLDLRVKEFLIRNNKDINSLISSFNIFKRNDIVKEASHLRFSFEVLSAKRGYETAYHNTCQYLITGDSTYLTRDYGIRGRIGNSRLRDDLINYINGNRISVETFVSSVTGTIKKKDDYVEDACRYTRAKYDKAYKDGIIKNDGLDWSIWALVGLLKNYDYSGFTRDNDSRKNLMAMVSQKDAQEIVAKALGITVFELQNMSNEELRQKCSQYIQKITEIKYEDEDVKIY